MTMTHASLFSGIGGFDLAAAWAGWTNVFNCEIDPFCRRVLKYHFPNRNKYEDIRTTDFTVWRDRVDVLTGGFPCQPFSLAGKRKGTADDRYLWPAMLGVVRTVRPRWVVGENVLGIVNWSQGMVSSMCALIWKRQEAEERMREKAHKIVKEMMGGIFQGDMPQKIADEFIQKLSDE